MEIALVADDAIEPSVHEAIAGLGHTVQAVSLEDVDDFDLVVGAGRGDTLLQSVNDTVTDPWIGIELGSVGGIGIDGVSGAVAIFNPTGPCFRCLTTRVGAALEEEGGAPATVDDHTTRHAGAVAGHLGSSVETVRNAVGTVHELDGPNRRLLAVPGCCSDRHDTIEPALSTRSQSFDTTLDRAETTFDDRLGIVTQVGEQASYPVPYYIAQIAETAGFSDRSAASFAAGVDRDWDRAFMRAVGEALERYCAGVYRLEALSTTADEPQLDLQAIPVAKEEPEPLGRFWPGKNLHTTEPVALPVESVVFPPPEDADVQAITTGLGFGTSTVDATLAGTLEVLERDACMLAWYSTFEPIALEVDRPGYTELVRRVASEGLAATTVLVTQDVDIPIVTAAVHRRDADGEPVDDVASIDPDAWPAFAVGSAAAFDAGYAAERALSEAIQNWTELRQMGEDAAEREGAIAEFASFPRDARALLDTVATVDATDVTPSPIPEGRDALDAALDATAEADIDLYVANLTTPEIADLGFASVRVISPDAQPLRTTDELVTDRLRSIPRNLGFRPRLDRGRHPYP